MATKQDNYVELMLNFAASGSLRMVKRFIEVEKVNVNSTDSFGHIALHKAAKYGHIKIVHYLLGKGSYLDQKTECNTAGFSGITPFFYAVWKGHVDVAKTLMQKGAQLDIVVNGFNLLDAAAESNNPEMIYLILNCGYNLEQPGGVSCITPLARALGKGKVKCAKILLKQGADHWRRDKSGLTPLHYAIKGGQECTKLLLKHVQRKEGKEGLASYINCNSLPKGCTVLHLACIGLDHKTAKVLIKFGVNPAIKNEDGYTALEVAELNKVHWPLAYRRIKSLLKTGNV